VPFIELAILEDKPRNINVYHFIKYSFENVINLYGDFSFYNVLSYLFLVVLSVHDWDPATE
jgi:hypothetical protein